MNKFEKLLEEEFFKLEYDIIYKVSRWENTYEVIPSNGPYSNNIIFIQEYYCYNSPFTRKSFIAVIPGDDGYLYAKTIDQKITLNENNKLVTSTKTIYRWNMPLQFELEELYAKDIKAKPTEFKLSREWRGADGKLCEDSILPSVNMGTIRNGRTRSLLINNFATCPIVRGK